MRFHRTYREAGRLSKEMKDGLDIGSFAMFVDPETGMNAMGRVNYFRKNAGEPVVLMGVHALETENGWERVDRATDYVELPLIDVQKLSYSEYKDMQRAANVNPRVGRLRKKLQRVSAELAKLERRAEPRLGPEYTIPVNDDYADDVVDPEVLSWFHAGQGDPVYALESRLFAYGTTLASRRELEAVEAVLDRYNPSDDDSDDDMDRIYDTLDAVRNLLADAPAGNDEF